MSLLTRGGVCSSFPSFEGEISTYGSRAGGADHGRNRSGRPTGCHPTDPDRRQNSGVDPRLADPSSLKSALAGVEAVFLVFPSVAADHAAPRLIATLAAEA